MDYEDFLPVGPNTGSNYDEGWDYSVINGKYLTGPSTHTTKKAFGLTLFVCPSDNLKRSWGHSRSYSGNRANYSLLCGWLNGNAYESIRMNEIKATSNFILVLERAVENNIMGYRPYSYSDRRQGSSPHTHFPAIH